MTLKPITSDEELRLAHEWLTDPDNAPFFDWGRDTLPLLTFRVMAGKADDVYRLFTADNSDAPIGLAVLSGVNLVRKTADYWLVLGSKEHRNQGYGVRVLNAMMEHAFVDLGLDVLHCFVAEPNRASLRMLEKAGWQITGRQRRGHWMDGGLVDRFFVDILREEYLAAKNPI
jgi:RimJ/RimL family protein N-acetyltransferase